MSASLEQKVDLSSLEASGPGRSLRAILSIPGRVSGVYYKTGSWKASIIGIEDGQNC